jgi:hypothetical protein
MFPNKDKKESKHPDWRGNALIDGVKYSISAWNKSKDGMDFFTGQIRVDTYRKPEEPRVQTPPARLDAEPMEEQTDLPF